MPLFVSFYSSKKINTWTHTSLVSLFPPLNPGSKQKCIYISTIILLRNDSLRTLLLTRYRITLPFRSVTATIMLERSQNKYSVCLWSCFVLYVSGFCFLYRQHRWTIRSDRKNRSNYFLKFSKQQSSHEQQNFILHTPSPFKALTAARVFWKSQNVPQNNCSKVNFLVSKLNCSI